VQRASTWPGADAAVPHACHTRRTRAVSHGHSCPFPEPLAGPALPLTTQEIVPPIFQAGHAGSIPVARSHGKGPGQEYSPVLGLDPVRACAARAVQLARRHECARRTVVVAPVSGPLRRNVGIDGARDELIGAADLMQVDHRRTLAVVPHPCHEILEPGTADRREVVACMPKIPEGGLIVKVQALRTDRPDSVRPGRHLVEVVTAQWSHPRWLRRGRFWVLEGWVLDAGQQRYEGRQCGDGASHDEGGPDPDRVGGGAASHQTERAEREPE
jgi:hypothetical protein